MKKIKRKHVAVASWAFIWYGAIFSVQSSGDARFAGVAFWSIGIALQLLVAVYLISQLLTNQKTTQRETSTLATAR
jgi:hypothetical protein